CLPSGSGARGCAAYRPSRAAAPAFTDDSSDQASAAPMGSDLDVVAGRADDFCMGEAEEEVGWGHVPHNDAGPIAGSSQLATAPPRSIHTSSVGKRTHSDMTGTDAQSPVLPPPTTFTSVSQQESGPKKVKTSNQGSVAHIKAQPEASGSGGAKAGKATNAVAMIGMQGALNRLTDTLVMQMVATNESHITDQRKQAIRIVQDEDSDLSLEEKVALMNIFVRSTAVTSSYVETTDPTLCRTFTLSVIQQYANT
ncbi:hypothetical protein BDR05DRAFT_954013, partial [Suillus weaverae]